MKKIFELFNNFNGKTLIIISMEENKELFKVKVDIKQLPHLLGLHYVYAKRNSEIIDEMKKGRLTLMKVETDYLQSSIAKSRISLTDIRDRVNQFYNFLLRLSNETQMYIKVDKGITELNHRPATYCIIYPKTAYNQQYLQLFIGKRGKNLYCESFIPDTKPKFSGKETEVKIKIE